MASGRIRDHSPGKGPCGNQICECDDPATCPNGPFPQPAPDMRGKGLKFDAGKAPIVQGLFRYFPRALKAVANVSGYGFQKYKSWGGWRYVPDALNRYEDGFGRHTLDEYIDGPLDPESGLRHKAHRAWNALATLELALIEAAEAELPRK